LSKKKYEYLLILFSKKYLALRSPAICGRGLKLSRIIYAHDGCAGFNEFLKEGDLNLSLFSEYFQIYTTNLMNIAFPKMSFFGHVSVGDILEILLVRLLFWRSVIG